MPKYSNSSGGGGGSGSGTYYTDIRLTADTEDNVAGLAAIWRAPVALTVTGVSMWVSTAPTGSGIVVDILEGGVSIMTTNKLKIDATEKTSATATAPAATITDASIAADAEVTIEFNTVGSSSPGKGTVVRIIWTET